MLHCRLRTLRKEEIIRLDGWIASTSLLGPIPVYQLIRLILLPSLPSLFLLISLQLK